MHALLALAALSVAAPSCGDDASPGAFPPSASFAERCPTPRSGIDPNTNVAHHDSAGTLDDEKHWLRSWTHEFYLWYREVADPDPAGFATELDYFDVLKTMATTASGKPKDQFHFTYDTPTWEMLSQAGVSAGYGVQWVVVAGRPPRQVRVAYNEPGSPAAAAGVARGAQVLTVDGVDVVNGSDITTLNNGLFPTDVNQNHTFQIVDLGATAPRTVTLTSTSVTSQPVQNVQTFSTSTGTVGYMLFNDHLATAEKALVQAINDLRGVNDLIIDIRYNGGGYLVIASQLAYIVAGAAATSNKAFEKLTYNDQYPNTDPFSGQPNLPFGFANQTVGLSLPMGQALPTLGLSRVFVLTGSGTCSASESVINGLRGVDVEVIQIGGTTCGKPYGFIPQDNCGTTYFSIQFQGVNNKGFGDYADGFTPAGTGVAGLPGCAAPDDFNHALGDVNEARLAAALQYRVDQSCPPAASLQPNALASGLEASDGLVVKSAWQQNRILLRR